MKKIICLYGLPASGKTTQAEKLTEEFGYNQFGMGDILRTEIESGSELGQKLNEFVEQGKLIPDELMEQVLKRADLFAGSDGVIFDGFPRIISQAEMMARVISELDLELIGFFCLNISRETAIARIAERAKITERQDDLDPVAVKNRLDVFATESIPLLEYYRSRNKLIEIDGEADVESVYAEIKEYLS